jgi:hypothetical protein
MRAPTLSLTIVVVAFSALMLHVNTQDVNVNVAEVPDCLPQTIRVQLLEERSGLVEQFKGYNNKVDEFRGKCSLVHEGTDRYYRCLSQQNYLQKRQGELVEINYAFKHKVDLAVAAMRAPLQQHIEKLRDQIHSDETAIRRLGFQKRAEEFDDWIKLAETAQKEYERETRDALIDLAIDKGLEGLKQGITTIGSLNPPKANKCISQLKALGVGDPYLFGAIRRLALVRGKPARARAINNFLDRVKDAVEAARIEKSEGKLDAFTELLGELVTDRQLSLLLIEIKFATAALYNNVAQRVSQHELMRLTALNEQELKALQKLSELLEKDVRQLNNAKQELALLCEAK